MKARFVPERTAGSVLCECPPSLCRHPSGYRDVTEWVVVDTDTDAQVGGQCFDRYRDAKQYADRRNNEEAGT